MNNQSGKSPGDYSFLRTMSTEELQEILRRDMDLDRDDSDTELIWHIMETLAAREPESAPEHDEESALTSLRERIEQRRQLFAGANEPEGAGEASLKPGRVRHFWRRFAVAAAAAVLVLALGLTAAGAKGYDLWGSMLRWANGSFAFGPEQETSFDYRAAFSELDAALREQNVLCPVLPRWLPTQYRCEHIRIIDQPKSTLVVAMASDGSNNLMIHVENNHTEEPSERRYEGDEDTVRQIEANGIVHYVMKNGDSVLVVWTRGNIQAALNFSGPDFSDLDSFEKDLRHIIGSIYEETQYTFVDLEQAFNENDISIPVTPNWLPGEYVCLDVQTASTPIETRITSFMQAPEGNLLVQVLKHSPDYNGSFFIEKDDEPAWTYETHGVVHNIMKNSGSTVIAWESEDCIVALHFTDPKLSEEDVKRIIESIYET